MRRPNILEYMAKVIASQIKTLLESVLYCKGSWLLSLLLRVLEEPGTEFKQRVTALEDKLKFTRSCRPQHIRGWQVLIKDMIDEVKAGDYTHKDPEDRKAVAQHVLRRSGMYWGRMEEECSWDVLDGYIKLLMSTIVHMLELPLEFASRMYEFAISICPCVFSLAFLIYVRDDVRMRSILGES